MVRPSILVQSIWTQRALAGYPTEIQAVFVHVLSATSDFGEVKKTRSFYTRICQKLDLDPSDVVHVGDHWEFDYLAPARAGIQAYFMDRSGRRDHHGVVYNLKYFAKKVFGKDW